MRGRWVGGRDQRSRRVGGGEGGCSLWGGRGRGEGAFIDHVVLGGGVGGVGGTVLCGEGGSREGE